ncbi:AfsR/SARP family transcriptional regulator [Tomitella gaofuii]|uniref:AfsR/SARP family transcriptional regulator n=1 Tax=Tomitella gaofuii TaxID=2760083 RepID=UPI0015FB50F8|nr:BTAD domain-containing putative transcriptional regulator [Tomitella gaofuii]
MGLQFGVLGTLEVSRGGSALPVPGGRRRAVLARLLVQPGHAAPADALIEAAWGERLPKHPRDALHTVLSRLRTLLGDDALRADSGGYALTAPGDAVDSLRFEALCARAASSAPEPAGDLLDRALALWRGPAFAEYSDLDFATATAARLDLRRLGALETRAALHLDAAEFPDAVERLEEVLAEDPHRERAMELLMTALTRDGRRADAVRRYERFLTRLADEFGIGPSSALREARTRIVVRDPTCRLTQPPPHRGASLDTGGAFFGREAAQSTLVRTTAEDRLVTVTGTGGVGKTRLVAEALPALARRSGIPIAVVGLATVAPGGADDAVAAALGLGRPTSTSRDAVVEYLSISSVLLVLDNCEHLLAEAASLVESILRSCPRVRVIATSRHRLGVRHERVLPLDPLPVPDADRHTASVRTSAALGLFLDRVKRLHPSYSVTTRDLPVMAEICRRLDGLPLALELAASRASVVGLAPVVAWLDSQVPGVPAPELSALIDWSYRLLSDEQRRLLSILSVFAAEFDIDDVQELLNAPGLQCCADVPTSLAALVEASLLSRTPAADDVRYRMLSLVRSFAAERLAESGVEESVRTAHAERMRRRVEKIATGHDGRTAPEALARLRHSRADIGAAVRWSTDAGRYPLAAAITGPIGLCPHWEPELDMAAPIIAVARACAERKVAHSALAVATGGYTRVCRGELDEGRSLALVAADMAEAPRERFLARFVLGVCTVYAGEHEESRRWWQEIERMDGLGVAQRAEAHIALALLACFRGELDESHRLCSVALAATACAGVMDAHAFALYARGEAEARTDPARGADTLGAAAEQAADCGAYQVNLMARVARLATLVRLGEHAAAVGSLVPLLHDERRSGAWPQVWKTVRSLAELCLAHGRDEDAAFFFAAADAAPSAPHIYREEIGRYAGFAHALRERLEPAVADVIEQLARGATRTAVVERAIEVAAESRTFGDEVTRGRAPSPRAG